MGREGAKIMQKIISGVAKGVGAGGKAAPGRRPEGTPKKYCGGGGGGHWGRQNPKKNNGAPFLSLRLLSIVASGEGGGALGAPKS